MKSTIIIDDTHICLGHMISIGDDMSLAKGFGNSKSFASAVVNGLQQKTKGLFFSPKQVASAIMTVTITKLIPQDFFNFCSVENRELGSGVRVVSIPEIDIENRLLIWSKRYGALAVSRKPIEDYPGTIPLGIGDFFLAVDSMPNIIVAVNNKENEFTVVEKASEAEEDLIVADITSEVASLVFDDWFNLMNQNESEYEVAFLSSKNIVEC